MLKYLIGSLVLLLILVSSCERDQVQENLEDCPEVVTYQDDVKLILNTYCSYPGCHNGGIASDFSGYNEMQPYLTDEFFVERVINIQDMPPTYAEEGFQTLSPEDIVTLSCWVQGGYLED